MKRAVFLDLNGTLALPVTVEKLGELRPVPGAAEAVARLCRAGFVCPVVTIQSRIAKPQTLLYEQAAVEHRIDLEQRTGLSRRPIALEGEDACCGPVPAPPVRERPPGLPAPWPRLQIAWTGS